VKLFVWDQVLDGGCIVVLATDVDAARAQIRAYFKDKDTWDIDLGEFSLLCHPTHIADIDQPFVFHCWGDG
jgi:hypothetical protein